MKPNILAIIELCKVYYQKPGNGVGGNLHIVLDDGNLKDSHIEFCLKQCREKNDLDGALLCGLFLQLSMTQRKKIYNSL